MTGVLVVQHEGDAGLGRLEPALRAHLDLDVRRPDLGDDLPADLAGYGGLIVLGGAMGATDDDVAPWLPGTRRLLATGLEDEVPTIGICLGAQLLAVATGGHVERGAGGLEVGLVAVRMLPGTADDALLGPVVARCGTAPLVPQFHQDAVTRLPAGAVLLGEGERYPHQAYRLGACAWGLQYHPEVTREDWAQWLRDGHGAVRAAGLEPPDIAVAYTDALAHLDSLAQAHAEAMAAILSRAAEPATD